MQSLNGVDRLLVRMDDKTAGCENLDSPETDEEHEKMKNRKSLPKGEKNSQVYTNLTNK